MTDRDDVRADAADSEPDALELEQAEALAAALEHGRLDAVERQALPEQALESAALLRHYRDPELSTEAGERVLQGLLEQTRGARQPSRVAASPAAGPRGWLGWLAWLAPAVIFAGIWFVVRSSSQLESTTLSPQASQERAVPASEPRLDQDARPALTAMAELPRERREPAGVGIASAVATDQIALRRQQRDILSAQAELIREGSGASSPGLVAALKAVRGQLLSEAAEHSSQTKPLAALRRAHAAADEAKTGLELKAAVEQLEQSLDVFGGSEPSTGGSASQEQLLQDGYFRLAEMEQRLGHHDRAIDYADRGLDVSSSPSVARANLFIVKAQAQSALGESSEAAQSLMQALGINELLMKESLDP